MNSILKKGFTLIELLVVVAIIGILSQVVLLSVNGAKSKAANASIKADLQGIRAQAAIIYDNSQSYFPVCTDLKVISSIKDAIKVGGDIMGTVSNRCNSDLNTWSINVLLKAPEGTSVYWCVDSTGIVKGEPAELGGASSCL